MPPGGEDLITRGEWVPLPSSAVALLVVDRSLTRDAYRSIFSKIPVSRGAKACSPEGG